MAINARQVEPKSELLFKTVVMPNPRATTVNFFVASVDPSSAVTVGTPLTLAATASGLKLRVPRKPTLVLTDASGGGGGLSVTVTFFGNRFGKAISETVTVTCTSGAATTGTCTQVFDQVTSVVPNTVTGAAAGDALTCGISGDGIGLPHPIDRVNSVVGIYKIVSGTEATAIAISSTTVDVANSSINHGGTITAANDTFEIHYFASVNKDDGTGYGNNGVYA
jgi:hypothetical protein